MTLPWVNQANNEGPIATFFASKGLDKAAIAGILGNAQVESDFSPTASNPKEGAIGIFQWEGGRRVALQQYAASVGGKETDLNVQLAYAWQEIIGSHKAVLPGLQSATTANQAALDWATNFEGNNPSSNPARETDASAIFAGGTLASIPTTGVVPAGAPFKAGQLSAPLSDAQAAAIVTWINIATGDPASFTSTTGMRVWTINGHITDDAGAIALYEESLGGGGGGATSTILNPAIGSSISSVGDLITAVGQTLFDGEWWKRVGIGVLGAVVIAVGAYLLLRSDGHAPSVGGATKGIGEAAVLA